MIAVSGQLAGHADTDFPGTDQPGSLSQLAPGHSLSSTHSPEPDQVINQQLRLGSFLNSDSYKQLCLISQYTDKTNSFIQDTVNWYHAQLKCFMYLEYSVPATVNERKVWLWLYLLKLCDPYLKKDFNVISKPQTSYKTQAFLYVNKRGANLKNEVTSSLKIFCHQLMMMKPQ